MSYGKLRDFVYFMESNRNKAVRTVISNVDVELNRKLDFNDYTHFHVDAPLDEVSIVELAETATLLHDKNLLRLPYPTVLLGAPISLIGDNGKDVNSYIIFVMDDSENGITLSWFTDAGAKSIDDPRAKWISDYHILRFAVPGHSVLDIKLLENRTSLGKKELEEESKRFDAHFVGYAIACLALLRTKGIRKEIIEVPKKLNKARVRRRKKPLNDITVIRIQEHMEGVSRGSVGERHRPRLHIRRGHWREQRYGPGNTKTKEIFIEPCLVGYEEEGVISHDHYEVDETPVL
jgi:hypothetical protein